MLAGDFVLASFQDSYSQIVEQAQGSRWGHVYSVLSANSYLNTLATFVEVTGALWDGPNQRLVSPDLSPEQRAAIATELRREIGRPYGYPALLWLGLCQIFPPLKLIRNPATVYGEVCSTALAKAYFAAGCYDKLKVQEDWSNVSPADLAHAWGVE